MVTGSQDRHTYKIAVDRLLWHAEEALQKDSDPLPATHKWLMPMHGARELGWLWAGKVKWQREELTVRAAAEADAMRSLET